MTKENLYEVEFETLNKKEITPFESKAAILNSKLDVSVILGKCKKNIKDIVNLQEGDIIFLDKTIDENLDIYVNDKYYIIEGHHRNFASAYIGKTLIPYTKSIMISENEAKIRAKSLKLSYLYDYEETFKDKNGKMNFRYTDIYPDIYEQVKHYENLEQFEI